MKNTTVQKAEKRESLPAAEGTRSLTFTPRVDILEKEDELLLYADVPGVKQQDVDLRFEKGELLLNCRCSRRHPEANMLLEEYGIGDFYRAFTISEQIDADKIYASLQNGVLTVHLPKRETLKPRKIAVKAS